MAKPNRTDTTRRRLIKKRERHLATSARHEPGTSWHTRAVNAVRQTDKMLRALEAEGATANWAFYDATD